METSMDPHKFITSHSLGEVSFLKPQNGMPLSDKFYRLPHPQKRHILTKLYDVWSNLYPTAYFPVYELLKLEWVWRGQNGRTLPQRIATVLRQFNYIPESVLGEIGDSIRTAIPVEQNVLYDIVDKFNWEAGDFGDGGSCFWEGRIQVRQEIGRAHV